MNVFEAIRKRRSVRELVPVEIPMEDLEKIVDTGRRAASGMNAQPREFIVITDQGLIEQLALAQGFIRDASAVVAVVADDSGSMYWLEDVAASVENMLLAITALVGNQLGAPVPIYSAFPVMSISPCLLPSAIFPPSRYASSPASGSFVPAIKYQTFVCKVGPPNACPDAQFPPAQVFIWILLSPVISRT